MSGIIDGNASPYEAMAEAVKASVDQLLIPFHVASDPGGPLRDMPTEAFFQKFLIYADKFTGQCCQDFSKILRQASVVPEVRGTPTLLLAKQVRETVFEAPDKILVGYVNALRQINVDLRSVAGSFAETSVLGEALKGGAIGRVAGGFGDAGKVLGAVGAVAAAGREAEKQAALLEQRSQLEARARGLAFSKIVEYLKAVEALPENLLDYGCAKCFGSQIDFASQARAVQLVQASIRERVEQALRFTLKIQKDEREAAAKAVLAESAERKKKSEEASNRSAKGCGGCLAVVGIVVLVSAVGTLLSATSTASAESIGLGFAFGLGLLITGLIVFFVKKKKF
jgi:hypothetical protein